MLRVMCTVSFIKRKKKRKEKKLGFFNVVLLISGELHYPDRASCQLTYSTYVISMPPGTMYEALVVFFEHGGNNNWRWFPYDSRLSLPNTLPKSTLSQVFFQAFPIKAMLWVTSLADFTWTFLMVVCLSSFLSVSHTHITLLKSDSHVTQYSSNAIPCMCNKLGKWLALVQIS